MSDNWIVIVPRLPEHVPSPEKAEAALGLLEKLMPDADEIEVVQTEHVHFFDCGSNLETINCPQCSANIGFDWWGETMSSDYDEETGFRLDAHSVPCCSKHVALSELVYQFHQAFGCFALSAMNPNIGKLSDETTREIEAALGCEVSIVYQHI